MALNEVDRRGILWYLGITFGLTWGLELLVIFGLGQGFSGALPIWTQAFLAGIMFIPAIATVIVTKYITKEGLKITGLRLGPWKQYPKVLMTIFFVFLGSYLLTWILGLGEPDWKLTVYNQLVKEIAPGAPQIEPIVLLVSLFISSLTINPLVTSIATLGEELGWRGYLLPKLFPLGKGKAFTLSGLIWGLWHAPVIIAGYNYPGYPVLGVIMMILFTILAGTYLGALRLKYNSVLLATFAHAAINTQGRGLWIVLFPDTNPILAGAVGLTGLLFWAVLAYWSFTWTSED